MDDVILALNHLLEAERAGVEALVDLTRMSADVLEREMLQRIGGDEAWACASLRGQIEALGGTPSRQISPLLTEMRARDHFGARLRLFSQQQRAVLERLESLLEAPVPDEVRGLLVELHRVHVPNIAWCDQRAEAFGAREAEKAASPSGEAAQEREPARRGEELRRGEYGRRRGDGGRAGRGRRPGVEGNGAGKAP
jgi:hypothetical protein